MTPNESAPAPATTNAVFIHSRLDDLGLSPVQFRVYGHIARRAGQRGVYFESVPNCAAFCRVHIKTARVAIRELEKRGLIRLENARPGETKTYRVTTIEEWPPLPNGCLGIHLGRVSDRAATQAKSDPATPVSKREDTPTKRILPKVFPLSPSHEGNPIKGESHPPILKMDATPKISGAERISLEKELEAIPGKLKNIFDRASHDAGGPMYTQRERDARGKLRVREAELKSLLGWKI